MSLARGKYGIEYNPRQAEREPSGLRFVIAVVALVALISFIATLIGRYRAREEEQLGILPFPVPDTPASVPDALPVASNRPPVAPLAPQPPPVVGKDSLSRRPVKLRNLLMRLEEAERRGDVEMAVTTIETIRALPGSPAADIDDALARRLGVLNVRRLFVFRNAQWVREITVKRGDSASRIAAENGSTLASLDRLNGGRLEKVVIGRKLFVLNHPRFNLVIHRRSRTADLSLNGKFFKRYDLVGDVSGAAGAYELPQRLRGFWAERGVQWKPADRAELEMLLPVGAPVLVSEK